MQENTNTIKNKNYYEGLEISSVSIKWVRLANDNSKTVEVIRHEGNPREKIQYIVDKYYNGNKSNIIVTGPSAKILFNCSYRPETECIERALQEYKISPDIVLSLGGESFIIYIMNKGQVKNIISSSKCAAGTGEFLVQQLKRIGFSLEDGLHASLKGKIVPLATRCSVHCKSDATHKLNKGECVPEDIACSIIKDLAVKVHNLIKLTQGSSHNILLTGGLVLNKPFCNNLKEILKDSEITILPESHYFEAFGASLLASDSRNSCQLFISDIIQDSPQIFNRLNPLKDSEALVDYRVKSHFKEILIPDDSYILSVDAGSTTTKALLFNLKDGSIGSSCYLRTNGNPVEATRNCIKVLKEKINNIDVKIVQAAVTGSGREVVSVFLDNCITFNEILAHARAAVEEVQNVDTVFEIGGQDSKFISFLNNIPIDYAMNEGCSAGTGSFLEESAAIDMNIPFNQISDLALKAEKPVVFGQRCAAFINTDLRSALQQGISQEDVIAGLIHSVANNYISRVVGNRFIGDTILFQGGVALNKSVSYAIAYHTGKKVIVPERPEHMGSIGSALMIRDLLLKGEAEERVYSLTDLLQNEMHVIGTFNCNGCNNICSIKNIKVKGKIYPFGGLCSKFENHRKSKTLDKRSDLIKMRNDIMFNEFGPVKLEKPRGTIGLPMALSTYELFPFYVKLINEFGYDVVLSENTVKKNINTLAPICYPGEIMHRAVYDLLNRNVDYILLPNVLEMQINKGYANSFNCPTVSTIPGIIRCSFDGISDKLLSPHIGLSDELIDVTLKDIGNHAKKLGIKKKAAISAGERAFNYFKQYKETYHNRCSEELKKIGTEPVIILAGRSYVACSDEVNLSIPQKFISKGYHVIPVDSLIQHDTNSHRSNCWYNPQQIMNAISYVRKNANISICFLSCFSCGPDAATYHDIREQLERIPFCYLEIDSHTAHAGIETRIEAFLEIVEKQHKK